MQIVEVRGRFARCHVILVADGAILVDAPPGVLPSVEQALASAGRSMADLGLIILTHGDGDHLGGAAVVQDATHADVMAHELELDYVAGRIPASFPIAKRAFAIPGRRLPRPTITRTISGAGLVVGDLEVVHAPGHTPGHVVVYAGDSLIAGDAIRTGDRFAEVPAAMTADRRLSRRTIARLADRPIARAYSGHGEPAVDATARLRSLAERLPPDPSPP